ncbi:MAG: hypothetical protein IJO95_02160 [Clostridia bacterium]|nr:hypothetical protein [Clostridia bacterium]
MKMSKITKLILAALVLITAAAAALYLAGREPIPENSVAVNYDGETHYADLEGIRLTEIHGERINGKGEVKPVDGMGISLNGLLTWTLSESFACEAVIVTASDGVSAEITAAELAEEGKVMLLLDEEDGSLQLIVFGDPNSKRSVKQVERVTVK